MTSPLPPSRCLLALSLLLSILDGRGAHAQNTRQVVPPPGVAQVRTLEQNWTEAEAAAFYNVPQGSKLLPFNWFLHLEQPDNQKPFRDVEHMRDLGYIPRLPGNGNPHGLPVGFVKDGFHLGLTCAACHTAQIVHGKNAWIVDGAPTHGDFEKLLRRLTASLQATLDEKDRFDRFANNVLGMKHPAELRKILREDLALVVASRQGYDHRNLPRPKAPHFGPGRVDAFGAIMNEVSSTFAGLPNNHHPADAPVSYPFLWDAPQHDFVQWNGAAENSINLLGLVLFGTRHVGALGRNAGEVMGVFGRVKVVKDGLVPSGYPSTVHLQNLIDIEESLRGLWSPPWPDQLGAIADQKKAAGKELFRKHCVECHHPIDRKDENRRVQAWLKRSVGTDAAMAKNFLDRTAATGAFQGQRIDVIGFGRFQKDAPIAALLKHAVPRVLLAGGMNAADAPSAPFHLTAPVEIDLGNNRTMVARFQSVEISKGKFISGRVSGTRDLGKLVVNQGERVFTLDAAKPGPGMFRAADGTTMKLDLWSPNAIAAKENPRIVLREAASLRYIYKGRPLNGIWATAPYLHNGSVPNLDELLKKPEKRLAKFRVGSREFDPIRVGFRTDRGPFEFDTSLPGNRNIGHDYDVEFTTEERAALIEYMKSL